MNCKHKYVEGNTKKHFIYRAKNKAINEYDCKNCPLRLPDVPEGFEQLFQGFRR